MQINVVENPTSLDTLRPLPIPEPRKHVNRKRPPSLIYTSPESMKFIRDSDKDADDDFNVEPPKRGRGRGRGVKGSFKD